MEFKITSVILISFLILIAVQLWNEYRNLKLLKSVTSPKRGTRSERALIIKLLKKGIPSQAIFHDLYIRRPSGNYSQIDVVVLTKAGIIVFEVKDYKGWLFGKGYQSHWCQVLAYGQEKHRFYNPVKQNETHIASLKQNLRYCIGADTPVYSVIIFYGNCIFRDVSGIPDNVFVIKPRMLSKTINIIMKQNINANYVNKHEMVGLLRKAVVNGESPQVVAQHAEMVRRYHKS